MKTNYDALKYIFIQSSLTDALLRRELNQLEKQIFNLGEFRYWCWRYVFPKDVTKKAFTNTLLKFGFDNLAAVEIMNALNKTRQIVKEILDDARKNLK